MLSSLARSLGLGSPVSQEGEQSFLAVLVVLAPEQVCFLNDLEVDLTISDCLNCTSKKIMMFRFLSGDQLDCICHRLATSAEACQLNHQHFICWLASVTAAPNITVTIATALEKLGVVDSATVQYNNLVTTIEGGKMARTEQISLPEGLLTSATLKGPELRLQCPGIIYEALMGSGVELPYLLSVACANRTPIKVFACPDLRFDHEEGMTIIRLTLSSRINEPAVAFVLCLVPSSRLIKLHHSEASAGSGAVRVFYDCPID